jgi:hypothetical protein
MALVTANKLAVISASIQMPRLGAWTADLVVDAQAELTGRCTIEIDGGLTLVGAATRTGVFADTAYVRVTAGNDGLRRIVKPKHYRDPNLRTVLADLLRTANETLSSTADPATMATSYPAWTTVGHSVGAAISALLQDRRLNVMWRMLPDGSLWVGPETWPDSGLRDVADFQILSEQPHEGKLELGVEAPSLVPGMALEGRRLSYVEHRIGDGAVRTNVWVEG